MMNDVNTMKDCKICRAALPDLLLDPTYAASHADIAEHLATCQECRTELNELRATMDLMDAWTAPEPSPYFDSRMQARLREAVAAGPEGFWERMRSRLLFNTGRQFRPAMAGALAFVMLLGGGGTLIDLYGHGGLGKPVTASATIDDLKVLDNNAQAEQQMDQLLDDSPGSPDDNATPPTS